MRVFGVAGFAMFDPRQVPSQSFGVGENDVALLAGRPEIGVVGDRDGSGRQPVDFEIRRSMHVAVSVDIDGRSGEVSRVL
ncbi:hypothetical protein OG563_42955 [Nocardia vinacea]|uniref:Uncharacterized protein n=1 Tax=Nocardia vinacea TaxID=96468 RepID=A0ABZ1Z7G1_9NOCA|nr:hypothetical protein [Nocardia vinacea]